MIIKKIALIISILLVIPHLALAEDVRVQGTASKDYQLIGGSGWDVDIDNVISGPPMLLGITVKVGMATVSPAIPKGTIDPNIAIGDRVEAFGALDAKYIKLYGSSDYYIKKIGAASVEKAQPQAVSSDNCAGTSGWQDAPEIKLGEAVVGNFCPFSGGLMFKQVYRRFYVPQPGKITATMLKVPSNGVMMIWLQQVDDQSTFVSSPKIFDDQGNLISNAFGQPISLSADVKKPAYWGIMIQCATKGGLQDSEYSFVITQGCDWTGSWNLDSSPSNRQVQMELQQSGNTVTGSYSNQGRISGTVSGNKLAGTWSEPPDYSPPRNQGTFEFIMSDDCGSFSGSWGLGPSGSWVGQWNGNRVGDTTGTHPVPIERVPV